MAAPAAPGALHAQMHMQRLGPTLVFLQPVADGGRAAGPSLTVELTSGAVGLAEHSVPLAAEAGGAETVFGVILRARGDHRRRAGGDAARAPGVPGHAHARARRRQRLQGRRAVRRAA